MTTTLDKPLEAFIWLNEYCGNAWTEIEVIKRTDNKFVFSFIDNGEECFEVYRIEDLEEEDVFRNVKEEKWLVTYEGAGYSSKEEAEKNANALTEWSAKNNKELTEPLSYRVYKVVEE